MRCRLRGRHSIVLNTPVVKIDGSRRSTSKRFGGSIQSAEALAKAAGPYDHRTSKGSFVFHLSKTRRHHAAADEFFDRARAGRHRSAGNAVCAARPQAAGGFDRSARDLRVFAARLCAALSAGEPLSALGCRARRARTASSFWAARSMPICRSRTCTPVTRERDRPASSRARRSPIAIRTPASCSPAAAPT